MADDGVLVLVAAANISDRLRHWLPLLRGWTGCEVEEVGSTGVEGLPTKGDLDVAVVAFDLVTFGRALAALQVHLTGHEPQHWSATWASLHADGSAGEVGVQLVLLGGEEDAFLRSFRALLLRDPAVVGRYRALKIMHNGRSMKDYRAAKGKFVKTELGASQTR